MLAGLRLEPNITVATTKVSLLGAWLGLPRWASLPLDFTVLPGRSRIEGLTPSVPSSKDLIPRIGLPIVIEPFLPSTQLLIRYAFHRGLYLT